MSTAHFWRNKLNLKNLTGMHSHQPTLKLSCAHETIRLAIRSIHCRLLLANQYLNQSVLLIMNGPIFQSSPFFGLINS